MPDAQFDIIIVGGRVAGASLALRLAATGMRILVLEKDSFPGRSVVSCPLFFSSGMQLLDEIGIDEKRYAPDNTRFAGAALEMAGYFRTFIAMPDAHGRNYMYGLDRHLLDEVLWQQLDEHPHLTKLEHFAVSGLLTDAQGTITGVTGTDKHGGAASFRAGAVIGADGRHSIVARKCDAAVTEEVNRYNTTVYYAYWKNVAPYDKVSGKDWIQIHTGCDGFSLILIPASNGLTGVLAQCRQDYYDAPDGSKAWYAAMVNKYAPVRRRLKNAEQVTPIAGMKNVPNLYRQAWGAGWALVGDAYHQKDSYDGQGIYDALLGSKILAAYLQRWHAGELTWETAMDSYRKEIYAATAPMFKSTMARLKRELYSAPSPGAANSVLRWLLTNEKYRTQFGKLVTRTVHPDKWAPPGVILGALLSGLAGRIRGRRQDEAFEMQREDK